MSPEAVMGAKSAQRNAMAGLDKFLTTYDTLVSTCERALPHTDIDQRAFMNRHLEPAHDHARIAIAALGVYDASDPDDTRDLTGALALAHALRDANADTASDTPLELARDVLADYDWPGAPDVDARALELAVKNTDEAYCTFEVARDTVVDQPDDEMYMPWLNASVMNGDFARYIDDRFEALADARHAIADLVESN